MEFKEVATGTKGIKISKINKMKTCNKSKMGHSSDYNGVSWITSKKYWLTQISMNGTSKHVGTFDDEMEAAEAYDTSLIKYNLDRSKLNFPVVKDAVQPVLGAQVKDAVLCAVAAEKVISLSNQQHWRYPGISAADIMRSEFSEEVDYENDKNDIVSYCSVYSPPESPPPSSFVITASSSRSSSSSKSRGNQASNSEDEFEFEVICKAFCRSLIVNAGFTSLQDMLDYARGCYSTTKGTTGLFVGLLALKGELIKDIGLPPVKAQQLAGRLFSLLKIKGV